jgi:very-short-patch-repair endonuclease
VTQYSVRCQGWVGRVDFAWPDQRAILETDGFEYHASYGPFQRDRRRWSTLARTGWRLGIVTWLDVTAEPDYVVKLVRDLLDNQHTNVTDVV